MEMLVVNNAISISHLLSLFIVLPCWTGNDLSSVLFLVCMTNFYLYSQLILQSYLCVKTFKMVWRLIFPPSLHLQFRCSLKAYYHIKSYVLTSISRQMLWFGLAPQCMSIFQLAYHMVRSVPFCHWLFEFGWSSIWWFESAATPPECL